MGSRFIQNNQCFVEIGIPAIKCHQSYSDGFYSNDMFNDIICLYFYSFVCFTTIERTTPFYSRAKRIRFLTTGERIHARVRLPNIALPATAVFYTLNSVIFCRPVSFGGYPLKLSPQTRFECERTLFKYAFWSENKFRNLYDCGIVPTIIISCCYHNLAVRIDYTNV